MIRQSRALMMESAHLFDTAVQTGCRRKIGFTQTRAENFSKTKNIC
jgi:hypothetical protein